MSRWGRASISTTVSGAAERSKKCGGGGGGGRRLGVGMNGGVGVFDKEYQSAPVNQ